MAKKKKGLKTAVKAHELTSIAMRMPRSCACEPILTVKGSNNSNVWECRTDKTVCLMIKRLFSSTSHAQKNDSSSSGAELIRRDDSKQIPGGEEGQYLPKRS